MRGLILCLAMTPALASSNAHAGDPEAHSYAMTKAANEVAKDPDFTTGVGAPRVDGVAQEGLFNIFTGAETACPYAPQNPFGVGCAYATINGRAVNEPDNWSCEDPRQPDRLSDANSRVAPFQSWLATELAARVSEEAAMACNWTHFSSNPTLLGSGADTTQTYELVKAWAGEILKSIEADGATATWSCDKVSWEKYYERTANSLHYVQDAACEHHDEGNLACFPSDPVPTFNDAPIHSFSAARGCMQWLGQTIDTLTGTDPVYYCDEAVVQGDRGLVSLNPKMFGVAVACGFLPGGGLQEWSVSTLPRDQLLPLACMGLERTLRHHCKLDVPKTLRCQGPASDHSSASDDRQYCEGESYSPHGGQDFITAATAASVAVLREAAALWAKTCKEPDDPCEPEQCTTWCERTRGFQVDGGDVTGYCLNPDEGDDACVLHECLCAFVIECGGHGQQCCKEGAPCKDGGDVCGLATGTCVEEGTDTCKPEFTIELVSLPPRVPTEQTVGLSAHIVEPVPDGSAVVWTWSHAGVGSIEVTADAGGDAADSYARLITGSAAGTATVTVSARITPSERPPIALPSVSGSTEVEKGLRTITFEATGGVFGCSDPLACGVSEYTAFIVPRFDKALSYTAVLSGYDYPSCNRTVTWSAPVGDGGDCSFPVSYHPHTSAGATNAWAVWIGFGGPISGRCEVTVTLEP